MCFLSLFSLNSSNRIDLSGDDDGDGSDGRAAFSIIRIEAEAAAAFLDQEKTPPHRLTLTLPSYLQCTDCPPSDQTA